MEQEKLSTADKNMIFQLHNDAIEEETYGRALYNYCQDLIDEGKVPEGFDDKAYILSVDWPIDFKIDLISTKYWTNQIILVIL